MRWPSAKVMVAVAVAIHLVALLPLVGSDSWILDNIFQPYSEGLLDGVAPFSELNPRFGTNNYEYPPGSIPFVALPGLFGLSLPAFRTSWDLWQLGWDISIVVLIGVVLYRSPKKLAAALAIYTTGLLALGGLVLERFDLIPTAFTLLALALYLRGRSAGWGLSLGAAIAVKAWPLALGPCLFKGEHKRWRALLALALPIIAGFALTWAVYGDEPWSAFSYHAKRGIQIEALAATPFLVEAKLGGDAHPVFGYGAFNIAGTGVEIARIASLVILVVGYLLIAWLLIRRRVPVLLASAAVTGWLVVTATVLSPQFLIWVLPLAAIAAPLRWESVLLVASCGLTRWTMENYIEIGNLGAGFIWPLTARNLLLAVWLALMLRLALKMRMPSFE